MPRRPTEKDLLGMAVRKPAARREATLQRADRESLPARTVRLRWLTSIYPRTGFMMPFVTAFVFDEARRTFVNGDFVARSSWQLPSSNIGSLHTCGRRATSRLHAKGLHR